MGEVRVGAPLGEAAAEFDLLLDFPPMGITPVAMPIITLVSGRQLGV